MSRITRALLALTLLALAAPAAAAAAPTLVPVGTFEPPVHVASPPGDPSRLYVVEQPGGVRTVRNGVTLATPFLDIRRRPGRRRARPAVDRVPARLRRLGPVLRLLPRAAGRRAQVREYRRSAADPDRADPAGRLVWRRRTRTPTTTAARSTWARRAAVVRDRGRRRRQGPGQQRQNPAASSARCCGSTRAPATPAPTRSRPATRSGRRLGVRAAQPVPLLLRPRHRRPGDRRRRRGA